MLAEKSPAAVVLDEGNGASFEGLVHPITFHRETPSRAEHDLGIAHQIAIGRFVEPCVECVVDDEVATRKVLGNLNEDSPGLFSIPCKRPVVRTTVQGRTGEELCWTVGSERKVLAVGEARSISAPIVAVDEICFAVRGQIGQIELVSNVEETDSVALFTEESKVGAYLLRDIVESFEDDEGIGSNVLELSIDVMDGL
jgi:hypothetical protein